MCAYMVPFYIRIWRDLGTISKDFRVIILTLYLWEARVLKSLEEPVFGYQRRGLGHSKNQHVLVCGLEERPWGASSMFPHSVCYQTLAEQVPCIQMPAEPCKWGGRGRGEQPGLCAWEPRHIPRKGTQSCLLQSIAVLCLSEIPQFQKPKHLEICFSNWLKT